MADYTWKNSKNDTKANLTWSGPLNARPQIGLQCNDLGASSFL